MVPNGGTIEEMASHEELMAEKSFYALYMSQLKGKGPGVMPVTQRSSSSAPNAPIWPPKLDWEQQVVPDNECAIESPGRTAHFAQPIPSTARSRAGGVLDLPASSTHRRIPGRSLGARKIARGRPLDAR
jgi:hypothetical protein